MTWIAALVTSVGALVTLSVNTVTFDTQYNTSMDANGIHSVAEQSTVMHVDLDDGYNTMSDALEPMTQQAQANREAEEQTELEKAVEEAEEKARKDAEEAQAEEEKEALRQQAENEKELAKEEAEFEKATAQEDAEIEEQAAKQEAENARLQEEYEAQQSTEDEMYYYGQGY